MRILWIAGISIALLLAGAALRAADAAKGKELFMSKCAQCHDKTGGGKEAIAKMFKVQMKPLGSAEAQSKKDDEIKGVILKGAGKMRAVQVSDPEAADLIAFLRTLGKK